jgi:hypothetical protein
MQTQNPPELRVLMGQNLLPKRNVPELNKNAEPCSNSIKNFKMVPASMGPSKCGTLRACGGPHARELVQYTGIFSECKTGQTQPRFLGNSLI